MADVTTRRRVFLSHTRNLFGCESVSQSSKGRPKTPMNEGDLATNKAADEHFL